MKDISDKFIQHLIDNDVVMKRDNYESYISIMKNIIYNID